MVSIAHPNLPRWYFVALVVKYGVFSTRVGDAMVYHRDSDM